ncbi:E3 ubiquitin-protein ligase E3D [Tribolium madens]|uniref:E3 ubiquitin-protein ligase E3D n=1 Tax=Tribolium madens TaxID=41895 RepID=UPI001CF76652|nr:E3 ubiquitin-protein ligase E3D [Tribolium madens]
MDKNIYKTVILEIRPRLQSVNVVINLISPIEVSKISLNEDNFQIIVDEHVHTVCCKNLKIVVNSLSSLIVTQTYISFRFATVNSSDDWGSFKTEVLRTVGSNVHTNLENIFLNVSMEYVIQCKNCSHNLSENVKFERILPLPSENSDSSDWFCHSHGSSNVAVLNPKESDVFYGSCYCHLSKQLVHNVLETEKLVVCKRCLSWLGLLKNSETFKFWFNTVAFKDETMVHSTSPLSDTLIALREILNSILFNTAKIVLCCQSGKKQNDYILLWILEKQLNVQLGVKDYKVAKVLFKYENNKNETVKKWMEDSNVVSVDISKPMTVEILKHLYKFNKIFPQEFSESNNFFISYLMMYEHEK